MAREDFMWECMVCWVLNVNTDKFLQPRMPEEAGGR